MRKALGVLAFLTLMAAPAAAQEYPKWEIYGGYSYMRADIQRVNQSLRGWDFTLTQNVKPWLGGMLQFTGDYAAPGGIRQNVHTLMYGPVFPFRKMGGFTPSLHALAGTARGSQTYLGLSRRKYAFAAAFGGALDVKVHRIVGVRIFQADYMITPFLGVRQDNLRVSAGLVFYLGK